MIKKILYTFTFFLFSLAAAAQTMTDNQIIEFVKKQQEKGKSQQEIVTALLKKGVTVEKLKQLRSKYQSQDQTLGYGDGAGSDVDRSRSRKKTTDKEDAAKGKNSKNGKAGNKTTALDKFESGKYTNENGFTFSRGEEEDLFDFINDSLKVSSDFLENQVFGRNIFNNELLSFEPSMSIATPANYRLGAGDNVIIDIWGASQQTVTGEISPDGTVTVEGVGPVKIGGMSVSAANTYLKNKLGTFYADSKIQLSLGSTRSIQVQVMGEVKVPGTYTLSGLSTAFNALYMAGGINDIGTLRDIKVYRSGKQIATIDVYDYILNGNSKGDVHLQDNDIIVVGTYDAIVRIKGKVKRPMFYEMKSSESVKTILSYSGGFRGDAYRKNIRLIRKNGAQYSVHTIGEFDQANFKLADGDSLFIDSVVARYSNMAEVKGAVFHPGMFEVGGSISGVRDIINACDGLREDAFVGRAVMRREKDDLTFETLSLDIVGIVNGSVADVPLRKNDVIFIPSKLDMIGERTVKVSGEVNFPGEYMYADNTTVEDVILQAGGLTDAASLVKVDVFRRKNDKKATEESNEVVESYSFALKEGFVVKGDSNFVLQPYDEVVVRKNPSYSEQQTVTVEGSVNFPGDYAMLSRDYTLTDLIKSAGGITALGYVKGARLERVMTPEERNQVEATLRTQQIAMYEESMKQAQSGTSGTYNFAIADSLMQLKLEIGDTYPVAIDLEEAMKDPKGGANIVLREGDRIIVPQYSNTVKVTGDVMYPITMNYTKGKSLRYYVKRAGGYGDNARKKRVYAIYMNGAVKQMSHIRSKDVQPGCQIVVPSKKNTKKMTTAEIMSIGTGSASIAAVMATIANLFKK